MKKENHRHQKKVTANVHVPRNVLIVYKKSSYKIYFLENSSSLYGKEKILPESQLRTFKKAHDAHYATLGHAETYLRKKRIRYRRVTRGRIVDFSTYDLVITIGGDGTFLETARFLRDEEILGVNSDPSRSVGRFCTADRGSFDKVMEMVLSGRARVRRYHRFLIRFKRQRRQARVLNEVLVCHGNPAAMSRYVLSVGRVREEQRSSGLWIGTAAGSTGAVHSAGGKIMPWHDKKIQYVPRELYPRKKESMKLTGGILDTKTKVKIDSLMREGLVYIDGEHYFFPFGFGESAFIEPCDEPVRVIEGG